MTPAHSPSILSFTAFVALAVATAPATGQLRAEQCALIAREGDAEGLALAARYADLRGVPADQMLALPLPQAETLTHRQYEAAADRVRTWLAGPMKDRDLRCLVVFRGVPLKVAAVEPSPEDRRKADALTETRAALEAEWTTLMEDRLAALPAIVQARVAAALKGREPSLWERHDATRRAWSAYARELPDEARINLNRELVAYLEHAEGSQVLLELIQFADARGVPESPEKIAVVEQTLKDAEARVQRNADTEPGSPEFVTLVQALRVRSGLAGASAFLTKRAESLVPPDSEAAFDSELALVHNDAYPLARWIPNPLQGLRKPSPPRDAALMVARLDGPDPTIIERMMTDALHAERSGLRGTFYIDARGLTKDDEYRVYDRDLAALAEWTRTRTVIPVVLDQREPVFAEGSCPGAALYCGWYSLAKYVPAFTFERGAVGYHIASFELGSLSRSNKAYWCRGMLTDGAAATLGPTSEPYLSAFPRPSEFFGLLMTGELTLVECFARTNPFLSWRIALVGDPLYRPFAKNPPYSLDAFLEAHPESEAP
ncbi:MAG: TIGR03790 family protein [Phycisphaerae bacterium]|nr:MAG: TIGR03790 family protein [Planctomycetota bacterium]KAB2939259.1 MAG: TIGR03790 family protein [Phycisphaerae bacterium]MBE7455249.1 TIGR03790 family protein [Planctomycetia bacterium]MCK6464062.1 TIGR03790 family protein [Phycisphaerae bacterium]MCL4717765.1 TIGR03790 family protein [Phycisphaerae bacterium]